MAATLVLTKRGCKSCDEAKELLREAAIPFEEEVLDDVEALRHAVRFWADPGHVQSFPQIVYERQYIGGYECLRDALKEPLLQDDLSRFTLLIGGQMRFAKLWEAYKRHQQSFWTAEEVCFTTDEKDWEALKPEERHFLKMVLAFFAGADGIVNENLNDNFCKEVQAPEARAFYQYQMFNELVHSETYSILIDAYVKDSAEKAQLFNALKEMPVIAQKAAWSMQWMRKGRPFAERLVAFACVEGILFSSSFASIDYFKQKNVLPALCFSNTMIAADEGQHQAYAELLYSQLEYKLPRDTVLHIVQGAVDVEETFTREAVPCTLVGINPNLMSDYIRYVADRLLTNLGYEPHYRTRQPFTFINRDLDYKENHFERRSNLYRRVEKNDRHFELTDDF